MVFMITHFKNDQTIDNKQFIKILLHFLKFSFHLKDDCRIT